jgi:hypothetical protein
MPITIDVLEWLPNFRFSDKRSHHPYQFRLILKYLSLIGEWFDHLKLSSLNQHGVSKLQELHMQWRQWLIYAYYNYELHMPKSCIDTEVDEARFFGEDITRQYEAEKDAEDDIIESQLYQNVAGQVWIVFMNFNRLLIYHDKVKKLSSTEFIKTAIGNSLATADHPTIEQQLVYDENIEKLVAQVVWMYDCTKVPYREPEYSSTKWVFEQLEKDLDSTDMTTRQQTSTTQQPIVIQNQPTTTPPNVSQYDITYLWDHCTNGVSYETATANYEIIETEELLTSQPTDHYAPTPYEVYAVMHTYIWALHYIHPEWEGVDCDTTGILVKKYTQATGVNDMLQSWLDAYQENSVSDVKVEWMERVLFAMTAFPHLSKTYMYMMGFDDREKIWCGRSTFLATRPARIKRACAIFQPDLAKFMDEMNPLKVPIDYWFETFPDQSMTSENFKLVLLHEILKICHGWIYRHVVLAKAWKARKDQAKKISHLTPLFIKRKSRPVELLHKGKIHPGHVECHIEYYLEVIQRTGIPAFTDASEWPWIYEWATYMPNTVIQQLEKMYHTAPITRNIPAISFRVSALEGKLAAMALTSEQKTKVISSGLEFIESLSKKKRPNEDEMNQVE